MPVSWTVPMEIVRTSTDAIGLSMIVRRELEHCVFRPHQTCMMKGDGTFVFDLVFDNPKWPGREQRLMVRCLAVPHENRSDWSDAT
jgi:hypothetical protein